MENKQDLMVGNLMQDAKGRICRVEQVSVDEEDCKIYAINGPTTTHPISPIKITAKILIDKCGYKLTNVNTMCFQKPDSQTLYLGEEDVAMTTGVPMKYLHELQNRVLSVEGKRLQINLK